MFPFIFLYHLLGWLSNSFRKLRLLRIFFQHLSFTTLLVSLLGTMSWGAPVFCCVFYFLAKHQEVFRTYMCARFSPGGYQLQHDVDM